MRGSHRRRDWCDLGEMCALVSVTSGDNPDVCVIGGVGVGLGTIAGESQELAVGGPSGLGVIKNRRR